MSFSESDDEKKYMENDINKRNSSSESSIDEAQTESQYNELGKTQLIFKKTYTYMHSMLYFNTNRLWKKRYKNQINF